MYCIQIALLRRCKIHDETLMDNEIQTLCSTVMRGYGCIQDQRRLRELSSQRRLEKIRRGDGDGVIPVVGFVLHP